MRSWLEIAGYDKHTERRSVAHLVPEDLVEEARRYVNAQPEDDGEGAYPLDTAAALNLGLRMGQTIDTDL